MKLQTSYAVILLISVISVSFNESIKPFPDDLSMFDLKTKFKTHPFLYFNAEDIPDLLMASNSSHKFLADDIINVKNIILRGDRLPPKDYTKFRSVWNEKYGNNLPVLSIYYILNQQDNKVFDYIVEYLDRLASFEKWQTTSALTDEVPVAHILMGFVTAFDFLFTRLDKPRQLRYISQIVNKTQEMYEMSKIRWWGKAYLQNHVFTNLVALLTASLVIEQYDERASVWKQQAVKLLERNMYLLGYVIDGSIAESDHYHAYSTRSITQYIYLCKRHMNVDHTSHVWLTKAFWYTYGTVLPGLKEPVGFADSQPGWAYGYEANLFFLDKFVLRTGGANWLGMKIRENNEKRITLASSDKILSMHLEYLWFDQSLRPAAPAAEGKPTVFKYHDIGVVTFRTSTHIIPNNTFLSFKSGKLHGKFVNNLVNDKPKWLNGWKSFNPGHEQPDRNSFTFAPHGVSMVTEGWKNYKFTYLDNTLMFKPSGIHKGSCVAGWVGQMGECGKYLKYSDRNPLGLDAKIITSTSKNKILHVAGEAKGAYHLSLRLESFYRNILLLTPEVMVVIDHIQLGQNSPIQFVSSFFNNRYFGFTKIRDVFGKVSIGLHDTRYKDYKIAWVLDDSGRSIVNITNDFKSSMLTSSRIIHNLNNINITFGIKSGQKFKRIAYIFHGPHSSVQEFLFLNTSESGVLVKLVVNDITYRISIPTNYKDELSRQTFLRHNGYYSVQSGAQRNEIGMPHQNIMNKQSRQDASIFSIQKVNRNNISLKGISKTIFDSMRLSQNSWFINSIFSIQDDHPFLRVSAVIVILTAGFFLLRTKKHYIVIRSFPIPMRSISLVVIVGALLFIFTY